MTAPRQILPGKIYLVTRRCSERRFFLRPGTVTNSIFLYALAVSSRRHHVAVHGFCVMSNHYHLVVTDRRGRLPAFMQHLNSLVARATNAWLGRWEGFWSSEASYSAVKPGDAADVVRKIGWYGTASSSSITIPLRFFRPCSRSGAGRASSNDG